MAGQGRRRRKKKHDRPLAASLLSPPGGRRRDKQGPCAPSRSGSSSSGPSFYAPASPRRSKRRRPPGARRPRATRAGARARVRHPRQRPSPPLFRRPSPERRSTSRPANPTGAPAPTAQPTPGDDWHFFTHGYFRAPLRVGVGRRPACGAGQMAGTVIDGVPCAGPGQSTTNLHSPFLPDDQYLDWRYTRQWEQDWTEVFLNYGNSHVVGTVGFQAYNFIDAGFNDTNAQLGIAQGYVTVTPDIGLSNVRLKWRVGSFWEKYGQAGDYDAGRLRHVPVRPHPPDWRIARGRDRRRRLHPEAHARHRRQARAGRRRATPRRRARRGSRCSTTFTRAWRTRSSSTRISTISCRGRRTPAPPRPRRTERYGVAGGEVRVTGGVAGELYAGYSRVGATERGRRGPGDRGDPLARRRGPPDGQWAHRQLPGPLHHVRARPTSAPAASTPSNSRTITASASSTGSSATRAPASGATGWT